MAAGRRGRERELAGAVTRNGPEKSDLLATANDPAYILRNFRTLAVADVVLDVGYTFAWDYPFSLKHQNTSMVLVSGKGVGPFSGPLGATSVASEMVKLLKDHRVELVEE